MFNLNFLVSEGRCTRGANLQILKVDEEKSRYKYILLIDTEGLASSDESCNKKNKLVSFVIAISDLVLINAYGENFKAVEDLLPMVARYISEVSSF